MEGFGGWTSELGKKPKHTKAKGEIKFRELEYLCTSIVWEGFIPALKMAESEMQGRCLCTALFT